MAGIMKNTGRKHRIAALAVLGILSMFLAPPTSGQERPDCTCVEGNACWHYLRAPVSPPEELCSCEFCEQVTRHDGSRPWPKEWNSDCGAHVTLEGFLRRHGASWNLACSERNKPWKCSCHHPERHPICADDGRDWNRKGQETLARMVKVEKKLLGYEPVIVQSPHFYVVTDIPSYKLRTKSRVPYRIVRTHEFAHIIAERCEKAYMQFTRAFGAPTLNGPCGVFIMKNDKVAEMLKQRYLGNPRRTILHGGGGKSISEGHCFNGFVLSLRTATKDDRLLHMKVRHLIGHIMISCWHRVDPTERYLPRWLLVGAAHWLSKSLPNLRELVTFCGNESLPLAASGSKWDDKARKEAADPKRVSVQVLFDANTAQEMHSLELHLRAWSYFEVMLADDRERFVKFLAGLRDAKPARQAMREAMKCEPEEFDRRWAERLLGRRRSAAPTVAELDRADPSAPGAEAREAIRTETDPKRLASLVRALDSIRDVLTARTVLPLLGHESTPVREATVLTLAKTTDSGVMALIREEGLTSGNPSVLANVVRVVGLLRDRAAIGILTSHLDHGQWLVRANACRALGHIGDESSIDPITVRLNRDASPKAKIAAMLALAEFDKHAAKTAVHVAPELGAKDWQVRVAAAQTLAKLRQMSAVSDLITRIENEAGRVREECLAALRAITRDDLGKNPKTWRDWWEKELARKRGIPERPAEAPKKPSGGSGNETVTQEPTYYGIKVFSHGVGYVLDISGSMQSRFIVAPEVERRLGRTFQAQSKIGIAREELIHSIQALDPRATFSIILFNNTARPWKRKPITANESNKGRALSMIRNVIPDKETNYYGAFLEVFGLKADEAPGPRFRKTPDTIFFLTDGQPTVGDITGTDELRSWFAEENRFAQIRCHVIAFGTKSLDLHFLSNFAKENAGKFFHLIGE
jgi:HEAT repeats/von Willebrand factor type A domain